MTKRLTIRELSKKVVYHEKRANYYLGKLIREQGKVKLIGFQYSNNQDR